MGQKCRTPQIILVTSNFEWNVFKRLSAIIYVVEVSCSNPFFWPWLNYVLAVKLFCHDWINNVSAASGLLTSSNPTTLRQNRSNYLFINYFSLCNQLKSTTLNFPLCINLSMNCAIYWHKLSNNSFISKKEMSAWSNHV